MSDTARTWRARARRLAASGTLAVLAISVAAASGWVAIRKDLHKLHTKSHNEPLIPMVGSPPGYAPTTRSVRSGSSARISGARWKLVSIRSDVSPVGWDGKPEPVLLPRGTEYLVVRMRIELAASSRGKQLSGCSMELVDRQGRSWAASETSFDLPSHECDPTRLDSPARSWSYQQGFVVPRTVARSVMPLVLTSASGSDALLFER